MKKIILTILLVLLTVASVSIVWINQTSRENKRNNADSLQTNLALKKALLEKINNESLEVTSEWDIRDVQMKRTSLDEILKTGPRLCLFIDRSQCDVCWKKAIDFIKDNVKGKNLSQVCIMLSGFQPNDMRQFQSIAADIPIYYLVDMPQELAGKIEKGKTYFFVLENARLISHLFEPEGLYESMGKEYIQGFQKLSRLAKSSQQFVRAINPEIVRDSLSLRKKEAFLLRVENAGRQQVGITKVSPSCTCIMVEDFPKYMMPHSIGEIKVVLVPETKGWMMRTITVELDNGQELEFNIEAHVV